MTNLMTGTYGLVEGLHYRWGVETLPGGGQTLRLRIGGRGTALTFR